MCHSSSSLLDVLLLESISVDVVRRAFLQIPKSVELNEVHTSCSVAAESMAADDVNFSHCFGIEMSR